MIEGEKGRKGGGGDIGTESVREERGCREANPERWGGEIERREAVIERDRKSVV